MSKLVYTLLTIFTVYSAHYLCKDAGVRYDDQIWPSVGQNNFTKPKQPNEFSWWPRTTTQWPALGQKPHQNNYNPNVNIFLPSTPSYYGPWRQPPSGINNNRPLYQNNQNAYQTTRASFTGHSIGNSYQEHNNYEPSFNQGPQGNVEVQDNELRELSEELLKNDVNNAAKFVKTNFQGKTTSRSTKDEAPQPLFSINNEAFKQPTIEKLLAFHDNYIVESNVKEDVTPQEKREEDDFLNAIVNTPVMQNTRDFLIQKGKLGKDPQEFKNIVKDIWFTMYARGEGRVGSSGFEHVFLGEIKKGQVSGSHNWLYFSDAEKKNKANYLGYLKIIDLGNKGAILKYHFIFHGIDKPVNSMFIGTSPEFEMSLYTVCFLLRADKICPLQLNGKRFIIRTYTYRYRGKNLIGSAFPEI